MGEAEQNTSQKHDYSTQVQAKKSAKSMLTDFLDVLESKFNSKLKKEVDGFESELENLNLPKADIFDLESVANGLRSFGRLFRYFKKAGNYESLKVLYDILQNIYLNSPQNDDASITMYSLLKKYAEDV